MNTVAILNTQFVQVALPIVVTLFLAAWLNNRGFELMGKRIDDLGKRLDELGRRMDELKGDMNRRFDRLEALVSDHAERIVKLEERTSPLTRR